MDRQNPFDDIESLFDRISSEFSEFEPATGLGGSVAVDVADTGDAFEVTADVPGYSSDDIDVTLPDPRTVRIQASQETATESGDEEHQYVRRERTTRSTSRTVQLPDRVESDAAEASYDNGVLTITLPKREDGEGTDIPVN